MLHLHSRFTAVRTRHVTWALLYISNICNDQKQMLTLSVISATAAVLPSLCVSSHYRAECHRALPRVMSGSRSRPCQAFPLLTTTTWTFWNSAAFPKCFFVSCAFFPSTHFRFNSLDRDCSWEKRLSAPLHLCDECERRERQFAFKRCHSPGVISLSSNVEELWFDTTFHAAPVKSKQTNKQSEVFQWQNDQILHL